MDVHIGKVISNEYLSDRYYKISVDCPELASTIKEGQFVNILCSELVEPLLRRPFSAYRYDREKGIVEFVYMVKGKGTDLLRKFKEGQEINILGPLGNHYKIDSQSKGIAIIGRGVGIASIASLGEKARKDGLYVLAVLSGRTPEAIMAEDFLKEYGCKVVSLYDSDGSSSIDNLRNTLEKEIQNINQIYSCGSNRVGRLVKELSKEYNLDSYISFEEVMACGIGVCKGCTCETKDGYKTVCKDGPIFNVEEVDL